MKFCLWVYMYLSTFVTKLDILYFYQKSMFMNEILSNPQMKFHLWVYLICGFIRFVIYIFSCNTMRIFNVRYKFEWHVPIKSINQFSFIYESLTFIHGTTYFWQGNQKVTKDLFGGLVHGADVRKMSMDKLESWNTSIYVIQHFLVGKNAFVYNFVQKIL